MDTLEMIDALAIRARQESMPPTNIKLDMAALERYQGQQSFLFPMAWSAGVSLAAACLAIFLVLHSGNTTSSTTTDSITPLFAPTQVELP